MINCLVSYAYVDSKLLKAKKHPEDYKKENCYFHIAGMTRVIEDNNRKVSYFEVNNVGLEKKRDSSGKYYWVDATQIVAHLVA